MVLSLGMISASYFNKTEGNAPDMLLDGLSSATIRGAEETLPAKTLKLQSVRS